MASDMSEGFDGSWNTLSPFAVRLAHGDVQVTALPGNAVGPLGHERRHEAVTLRPDFREGLKERCAVGGFEGIAVTQGRFENAGAGLGVQAFDGKAHGLTEIEQFVIEVRMHGASEHGVAEGARRQGLELAVTFLAYGFGGLLEYEELKFGGGADGVSHSRGTVQYAPQGAARADGFGASGELTQKERGLGLEGDVAAGRRQDTDGGVGIGGVPAGEFGVVVELVVGVPAENHIAEAHVLVEGRQKLVAAEIFSPQDAVGIEDADLDVLDGALGQKAANVDILCQSFLPSRPLIVRDWGGWGPRILRATMVVRPQVAGHARERSARHHFRRHPAVRSEAGTVTIRHFRPPDRAAAQTSARRRV
jgi:hypothetical protein